MMGQRPAEQERLFYSFRLDDHVPRDHLLRDIDRLLDLGRPDLERHEDLATQLAQSHTR